MQKKVISKNNNKICFINDAKKVKKNINNTNVTIVTKKQNAYMYVYEIPKAISRP